MTRIAPVRLAFNPRVLWFNASDLSIDPEDHVVVETARGIEYGTMAGDVFEASDEDVDALKTPLKRVIRVADERDAQQAREMEELSLAAMPIYRQMAAESGLDMRPISVEYLFSGDKAIFYFESEERIDFRELVRQLASQFHVRVDMRQIGVRDEARMVGGFGHCGQELCCARLGGDFNPVSIRMAKDQDLSLNPQKISGLCGRLMCCLRYEFDAYKDFKSRAPKMNALIETPEGPAKVVDLDVPREIVTLKLPGDDEKPVKIPLADFDPAPEPTREGENARPKSVGADVWDAAKNVDPLQDAADSFFLTSQFTQNDKVGGNTAVYRKSEPAQAEDKQKHRTRRSRIRKQTGADSEVAATRASGSDSRKGGSRGSSVHVRRAGSAMDAEKANTQRGATNEETTYERRRRRRSTKVETNANDMDGAEVAGAAGAAGVVGAAGGAGGTGTDSDSGKLSRSARGVRPGHRSSGLRSAEGAQKRDSADSAAAAADVSDKPAKGSAARSAESRKDEAHAAKSGGSQPRKRNPRKRRAGDASASNATADAKRQNAKGKRDTRGDKDASGVSGATGGAGAAGAAANAANATNADAAQDGPVKSSRQHRRPRNRSRKSSTSDSGANQSN